jgi:hypothetical protein
MEPIERSRADQTSASNPILKPCPFCDGRAELATSTKPPRYGVICLNCPAEIPPLLLTQEVAVRLWNQRKGTASAFGGRATKGISTWKKRRACRRNLWIARHRKKSTPRLKPVVAV